MLIGYNWFQERRSLVRYQKQRSWLQFHFPRSLRKTGRCNPVRADSCRGGWRSARTVPRSPGTSGLFQNCTFPVSLLWSEQKSLWRFCFHPNEIAVEACFRCKRKRGNQSLSTWKRQSNRSSIRKDQHTFSLNCRNIGFLQSRISFPSGRPQKRSQPFAPPPLPWTYVCSRENCCKAWDSFARPPRGFHALWSSKFLWERMKLMKGWKLLFLI